MANTRDETIICQLTDIPNGDARGFYPKDGHDQLFIVRQDDVVFGYLNSCPHNRIPLEYMRHRFLSMDKNVIICFAHGAHFDINTGVCIEGICQGQSLTPVSVYVHNNDVILRRSLQDYV